MKTIQHIHHISAIVGNVNENLHFYQNILKLRLVKQTVNFDDSSVYHLYFANQDAQAGTLITFFPWEQATSGQKGSGQVGRIAFRVPKGSLDYWKDRLVQFDISVASNTWLGRDALFFQDTHGLDLALVESNAISQAEDILGFHGAELLSSNPKGSKDLLKAFMGLQELSETDQFYYLKTLGELSHEIIIPKVTLERGTWGPGTVHHIAWNVENQEELTTYADFLKKQGYHATIERDRKYFKSIYLREAGHVIYEFATAGPGMTVDEEFENLGKNLQLPQQFEEKRAEILAALEPLNR